MLVSIIVVGILEKNGMYVVLTKVCMWVTNLKKNILVVGKKQLVVGKKH